eukprot:gene783-835_t
MSIVLWPRQEILQLVLPQLSNCGRALTQKVTEEIIIKLSKLQNHDGKINLSHWQTVSNDLLKWAESSIYLFWDMLTLAVYYLNPEKVPSTKREDNWIEIECLAVFLILHIPESNSNSTKPNTVASNFDSVWPLNADGEVYPTSPVSSPLSPVKEGGGNRGSYKSPIGSPLSPRSPRNSTTLIQSSASSPKRSTATVARTPRGSTQHLHSVRQKIPLILSALNPNLSEAHSYDANDDFSNSIESFSVTRRMVDAFGMMLSGGHSRDQTVSPLSALHPVWTTDPQSHDHLLDLASSSQSSIVTSHDLISWINLHLSMNDLIYPVSMQTAANVPNPLTSSPSATINPLDIEGAVVGGAGVKDGKSHPPQKVITSVSTLSRFVPTVINTTSTTFIHVVTLGPSRSSSFRRINRSYSDSLGNSSSANPSDTLGAGTVLSGGVGNPDLLKLSFTNRTALTLSHQHSMDYDSEMESSSIHDFGFSTDITDNFNDNNSNTGQRSLPNTNLGSPISPQGKGSGFKPELSLPQLFVNYSQSSKLYFISPYYSATITGCKKSDIVIGAVFGAVIVSGCENIRLSVTCRKLIVLNCVDCDFFIATISPTVFIGDNRNNSVGPINTTYRNYRHHLKLTELKMLIKSTTTSSSTAANGESGEGLLFDHGVNQWARLCDANACVESNTNPAAKYFPGSPPTSSPTKTINPVKKIFQDYLPVPSSNAAKLMAPDKYHVISIPIKSEFISFEFTPIAIPTDYLNAMKLKQEGIESLKHQIHEIAEAEKQQHQLQRLHNNNQYDADMKQDEDDEDEPFEGDLTTKLLASSTISKRFMEWLVASDNAQEVLDLIRIDSDKSTNIHQ